ncbi:DUF1680 domain-containing protein [Quillaja saponaria]|uniref:DUF1680 domain-containing protein n=1 Tax=Quillaja saponaria TaxID=32244 RepID=A0AAD7VMD4_QUISA|nr:DUF1680 domain-containing protein [Quillaja saponaria]
MRTMGLQFFRMLVSFAVLFSRGCAISKECTNIPTELSSHTLRYELLSSKNETWKKEMFSHYHLTPTDDSAWSNLLPRRMLKEEDRYDWELMYKKLKNMGGVEGPGGFLTEVSLHTVTLDLNSIHGRAQQTNLEYLLMFDVDRLVWSFRKTAGLPTPGTAYGGWEASDVELRGHFVGHYLSASAQMWARYLSAFPSEEFDLFEEIKPVWAPYYTIHKILAGLLDQHTIAGNPQTLEMVTRMVAYFYNRVQNVIAKYTVERHYVSLNEETGGMNDVLYRLYRITGDIKHLLLAHLFDKPCFLGLLAVQADDISNFHANTHIPVVIGSQLRYEVTGDPLYKDIGKFFMDIVNSSHSYATGGTSVGEFWSDPKRLASRLETENEESCTTYNMLKVSRHLFRWTKEVAYADYYERALTNGVLSIQRGTEAGVMIYMLPQVPGGSKARSYHGWGTKFDSFWCCYGTGIESFSKLGDSIYFEDEKVPALYIIQYISSSLDWNSGQIVLNQTVDPVISWDPYLRVTITLTKGTGKSSTLNLRIPVWTHLDGAKATLNGQSLSVPAPGTFLSVRRNWSPGDTLTLQLPISLRTETVKDDRPEYASIQAILYGPYLLVGHTSGDWDIKTGSANSVADLITPIPFDYNKYLVSFYQGSEESTFVFTNSNHSITMEKSPEPGTDSSLHATFRFVLDGTEKSLVLSDSSSDQASFTFRVVAGLDRSNETVSLESESNSGCFLYSGLNYKFSTGVKLSCKSKSSDPAFDQAASFIMREGLSEYHPISFVAQGARRNFLLAPLLTLRDESYTTYFNIQA